MNPTPVHGFWIVYGCAALVVFILLEMAFDWIFGVLALLVLLTLPTWWILRRLGL